MTMTTDAEESAVSVREAAESAWASRAKLDAQRARNSFTTQLWQKLRISREGLDVDPAFFPEQFNPILSIGCEVDGLTFCLDDHQALAVVAWRCAAKGCEAVRRLPIKDYVSLGRALAQGAFLEALHPKCQKHE